MPATHRRTRQQIRRAIGQQTGKVWQDAGDVFSAPSETSPTAAEILDNNLAFGSNDEHRGKWVLATDSNSSTETRRVLKSDIDARSISVSAPFSKAPDTGWTYELWAEDLSPTTVHSFMDDAITAVTRKASVTVEADTFHTGASINAFALDSSWTGVKKVEYRSTYPGLTLASMDEAADSLTATTTVALDSADYREGGGSLRLTVAAGESSATAIANSSFGAEDIRGYDQLEFWFKTSGVITSSNYVIQLMQGSSAQVEVAVPASAGDKWTFHKGSISSPENNSSVTAVQVSTGSSDGGAGVLWVDDVKVTRAKAGTFETVPRAFWSLSQQNRELRIDDFNAPYVMLKVTGVRAPNLMTSDSDVCEVDANYVESFARGMALLALGDKAGGALLQYAEGLRNRIPAPSNVRWLED